MAKELKSYKDIYKDREALVVASGPSKFPYEELGRFDCPIFFVNDAVRFEKFASSEERLFFTHHPTKFIELVERSVFFYPLRYIRLDRTFPCNEGKEHAWKNVEYVFHDLLVGCDHGDQAAIRSIEMEAFPSWCLDRDAVAEKNCLFAHTGSITSLIHFLWYAGIKKARMIGCCPRYQSLHYHDRRISKLSGRTGSAFDLKAIIENQAKFLRFFGIETEHLNDYEPKVYL
jgi:hypothetical protein